MFAATILVACGGDDRPARLIVGVADTVVVNNERPTGIPVRVFDAAGGVLDVARAVRFRWVSGDTIPVSTSGTVTCERHGDAVVQASLDGVATTALLRCRPVHTLRALNLMQFVLGDSAQALAIRALDRDGRPVELLAGSARIGDAGVATLDDLRVGPRAPGVTEVTVFVGNHSTRAGVAVYEPVASLEGMRPGQRLVAVPLSLGTGEMRRWRIGAGSYLLSILPGAGAGPEPRLHVVGANCSRSAALRLYHCLAGNDAAVIVHHPQHTPAAQVAVGYLAVRRQGDLEPGDAAALRR